MWYWAVISDSLGNLAEDPIDVPIPNAVKAPTMLSTSSLVVVTSVEENGEAGIAGYWDNSLKYRETKFQLEEWKVLLT